MSSLRKQTKCLIHQDHRVCGHAFTHRDLSTQQELRGHPVIGVEEVLQERFGRELVPRVQGGDGPVILPVRQPFRRQVQANLRICRTATAGLLQVFPGQSQALLILSAGNIAGHAVEPRPAQECLGGLRSVPHGLIQPFQGHLLRLGRGVRVGLRFPVAGGLGYRDFGHFHTCPCIVAPPVRLALDPADKRRQHLLGLRALVQPQQSIRQPERGLRVVRGLLQPALSDNGELVVVAECVVELDELLIGGAVLRVQSHDPAVRRNRPRQRLDIHRPNGKARLGVLLQDLDVIRIAAEVTPIVLAGRGPVLVREGRLPGVQRGFGDNPPVDLAGREHRRRERSRGYHQDRQQSDVDLPA